MKEPELRAWYAQAAAAHGWSRAMLGAQIDTRLHEREGKAVTNFSRTLPPAQSDLAQQSLKDPYVFDFLTLGRDAQERDRPSIGLILCRGRDRVVVEYALRDVQKPIGIAEWETRVVASLPAEFEGTLPSVEALEEELAGDVTGEPEPSPD